MKVKTLIEVLEQLNGDAEVILRENTLTTAFVYSPVMVVFAKHKGAVIVSRNPALACNSIAGVLWAVNERPKKKKRVRK
jgi:hypothetical protein